MSLDKIVWDAPSVSGAGLHTKTPRKQKPQPVARVIDNGTPEGGIEWLAVTGDGPRLRVGDFLYAEAGNE